MRKKIAAAAAALLMATGAYATGTAAGTSIDNSVTLSYDVGGVAQTAVNSNTDTFVVDRKIDVIVTADNTPLDVPPSAQDQNLSFTIVNQGNDTETFDLAGTYNLTGDDFDPQNCSIIDSGGNTVSSVNLAEDANTTVYVSCDIPDNTQVQADDNGTVSLKATVNGRTNDSGDADDPTVVQNVFADGAGSDDNEHEGDYSARGTYHIISPNLTASKSSCVIDDPVNGTTNPKRIPGATVRYVIEVKNEGNTDAENVQTIDTIDSHLSITGQEILSGACNCASPSGSSAGSASTSGQDVTLDFGTVAAGDTECAYITTTVN
ncbi:hypothetical protein [Nitratifractor sp.]